MFSSKIIFLHLFIYKNIDFSNIDEAELVNLSQVSTRAVISSTPSSISSCSTTVPNNFSPISPPSQSSSPTTIFTFPSAFRWLLPPSYDPTLVTWSTNNNTSTTNTSQTVILSSSLPVQHMDIESVAKSLFQDIIEDNMYDDAEFRDVLEQWYKEHHEHHQTANQTHTPSI